MSSLIEKMKSLLGGIPSELYEFPIIRLIAFLDSILVKTAKGLGEQKIVRIISYAILEYEDELFELAERSETKIDDAFIEELVQAAEQLFVRGEEEE